jgi:4-hydroxybutyrate CoA-transferase
MYIAVSPEEAVEIIKSGDRVFVQSAAAAPASLIEAMTNRAPKLKKVEVVHLHTEGPAPYVREELKDSFRVTSLFIGGNVREAVNSGRADYVPIFLSEVPLLFRRGIMPLDVALVQVSPPDRHGFCSLGISVDASKSAIEMAKHVIAQVNPKMPRSHGDGLIHISKFDSFVNVEEDIPERKAKPLSEIELRIGKHAATLIEDGATIQMGIGAVPDAVLKGLIHHKHLGVHTEMFSDGIIELVESGVVDGSKKTTHPGVIVSGFLIGTRRLYDFVDDNPLVRMLDIQYVNDVHVIRRNYKMAAINSAIEVDLTGQVCSDSIGSRFYSGVGGQMDFIRGASLSEGGKPIIALPSVTKKGESRISKFLKQGAGVVTTRAHVHYVVTEYGIANLYGKSIRQRSKALIDIAHPDHREELERFAHERYSWL